MKGKLLAGLAFLSLILATLAGKWLQTRPFEEMPLSVLSQGTLQKSAPSPKVDEAADPRSEHAVLVVSKPVSSQTTIGARRSPPLPAKRHSTPPLQGTTNLLLVGLDRHPGTKGAGRPDTILIAVLSQKSKHLGLISVPRDLYVDIPGRGMDRINATFIAAQKQKLKALPLLKRVIEDTLHVPIHHSLAADLGGFERLVDALGGIEAHVPCPITDDFIDARSPTGRRVLDVDAGIQFFDGKTAALYARSRHGRSDWSRARRQQALLFGIKKKFTSIDGLKHLPEFWSTLKTLLHSDMSRGDFLRLVTQASRIDPRQVHGLVLGVRQASPHTTVTGRAVLIPHPVEIQVALGQLFSANSPGLLPRGAHCFAKDAALTPHKSKRSVLGR